MIDNLTEAISHAREVAEELKKEVERNDLKYGKSNNPIDLKVAAECLECAKDHEQLASWLEELKARREADRWIPVSERLPENAFIGCLVTVYETDKRTGDEYEAVLPYSVGYDGETWNDIDGEIIPFEVIAWRPLPKPYKESEA